MALCNGHTTKGDPCRRNAMPNGKCYKHGGKTPRGIASPHFRTGRHSKDMPARMLANYEASKRDPALLELREDIALLDARIADVLGRVDTGESGAAWKQAQDAYHAFNKAMAGGDKEKIREALYDLKTALDGGIADWQAWQDVRSLLEQRRRLVESERKRLVEMQQMLSVDRAMVLMGAIAGIIKEHVHDRAALAAISADIGKLMVVRTIEGD